MYKGEMMKISAVYKITNTITGDFYIGSSKDVKERWTAHKCQSTWKNYPNNPMYLDMQRYGLDKFVFEIIAEVEAGSLKVTEQKFIETLKPTYNNINANGWDFERYKKSHKESQKEYQKTKKYKEYMKEYNKSDKGKESHKKAQNKYDNQLCSYNGEILTLRALSQRFRRQGLSNPTAEAKKYLIKNNNPIEFYDVYP